MTESDSINYYLHRPSVWFTTIGLLLLLISFFLGDESKNRTVLLVMGGIFLFVGLGRLIVDVPAATPEKK